MSIFANLLDINNRGTVGCTGHNKSALLSTVRSILPYAQCVGQCGRVETGGELPVTEDFQTEVTVPRIEDSDTRRVRDKYEYASSTKSIIN